MFNLDEIDYCSVNFTSILRTAYKSVGPKSAKRHWWLAVFFAHLGSLHVNTACKALMKLTPDDLNKKLPNIFHLEGVGKTPKCLKLPPFWPNQNVIKSKFGKFKHIKKHKIMTKIGIPKYPPIISKCYSQLCWSNTFVYFLSWRNLTKSCLGNECLWNWLMIINFWRHDIPLDMK